MIFSNIKKGALSIAVAMTLLGGVFAPIGQATSVEATMNAIVAKAMEEQKNDILIQICGGKERQRKLSLDSEIKIIAKGNGPITCTVQNKDKADQKTVSIDTDKIITLTMEDLGITKTGVYYLVFSNGKSDIKRTIRVK